MCSRRDQKGVRAPCIEFGHTQREGRKERTESSTPRFTRPNKTKNVVKVTRKADARVGGGIRRQCQRRAVNSDTLGNGHLRPARTSYRSVLGNRTQQKCGTPRLTAPAIRSPEPMGS